VTAVAVRSAAGGRDEGALTAGPVTIRATRGLRDEGRGPRDPARRTDRRCRHYRLTESIGVAARSGARSRRRAFIAATCESKSAIARLRWRGGPPGLLRCSLARSRSTATANVARLTRRSRRSRSSSDPSVGIDVDRVTLIADDQLLIAAIART
jgi:hypothetical protein